MTSLEKLFEYKKNKLTELTEELGNLNLETKTLRYEKEVLRDDVLILEKALGIVNRSTPGEEKEVPKSSEAANE